MAISGSNLERAVFDQAPVQIGKYRIEGELGRGGMGVVYRGFDCVVERAVAIKTIGQTGTSSTKPQDQLRREAKAIGHLEHPNIVSLYDTGEVSGMFYLVMQLIHGETLQQRLGRRPDFPLQEIRTIMQQLLDALAYAHARGVVHRDIKPSNLMITPEGVIKLTDFGIAKFADARITSTGMVVGTPSYMSPEQVLGRAVDGRSDIFAAGCILYELVTRTKAFGGSDTTSIIYKIVHEPPPSPSAISPEIAPGLEAIILKALAKAPAERFGSCTVFRRELDACLDRQASVSPAQPHASRPVPVQDVEASCLPAEDRPRAWRHAVFRRCVVVAAAGTVLLLARMATSLRSPPSLGRPQTAQVSTRDATPADTPIPVSPPRKSEPRPREKPHENKARDEKPIDFPKPPPGVVKANVKASAFGAETRKPQSEGQTFAAVMLRGDMEFQRTHYEEALAFYTAASRMNPVDPFVKRKISVVLTLLGRPAAGRARP